MVYLQWYRVRQKWASGLGNWKIDYVIIAGETGLEFWTEEIVYETNRRWDYTDKYRGCDFEWLESKDIPEEIFKKEIENIDRKIRALKTEKDLMLKQAI